MINNEKSIKVSDYLDQLNTIQRQAVENTDGAALVIAGAGSGKTRVLTFRIAHLLNMGVKPYKILALTFTNKAANEMKERIKKIAGEPAQNLWMGTFHSIFAKILRYEAEHLGFTSNFTIYDSADSQSLIKSIVKDMHLDPQTYKPNEVLSRISSAKNNLITAQSYANNAGLQQADRQARKPAIVDIYRTYAQRCKKASAMDFDDLLLNTNILFRDFPEVLKKYQNRYDYILVDEYQDTNYSQYLIIKKLAQIHKNVCVVGDDAQSIYAFRGAKIENILNFRNDYPDYKLYKLEQNYRSTQVIVDAANSVIAQNKKQIQKNVFSENEPGNKIKLLASLTDKEEGAAVANSILDMRYGEQLDFLDFAILYRTNYQSRIFEEALRKNNIPYKIYGGLSFYQRKEIKDVLAYCRLVINPNDDEALKRIINYPRRGIGDTTVAKLEEAANNAEKSIWYILGNMHNYNLKIHTGTFNKIKNFVGLIRNFQGKLETTDAYDLVKEMVTLTGILRDLHNDKSPENVSRYENIQELLNGIKDFTENLKQGDEIIPLPKYMEDVALLTDNDNEKEEDKNKVAMMTIHSSKGLEFKNLYLVGVEEGLFPSQLSATSQSDLEEERRLFYVAVTRAEKYLTISFAKSRYKWGQPTDAQPSRFIKEIDSRFIDWPDEFFSNGSDNYIDADYDYNQEYSRPQKFKSPYKKYNFGKNKQNEKTVNTIPPLNTPSDLSKFKKVEKTQANQQTNLGSIGGESGFTKLKVGQTVVHARFGQGKVISIEGTSPDLKAKIDFKTAGTKVLILKFAKLKVKS